MTRVLLRTSKFVRAAQAYIRKQPSTATTIQETLKLLSENPFHPQLRTHKLKGRLANSWACSAGYDLRIIFDFVPYEDSEAILLLTIGTHDEVY